MSGDSLKQQSCALQHLRSLLAQFVLQKTAIGSGPHCFSDGARSCRITGSLLPQVVGCPLWDCGSATVLQCLRIDTFTERDERDSKAGKWRILTPLYKHLLTPILFVLNRMMARRGGWGECTSRGVWHREACVIKPVCTEHRRYLNTVTDASFRLQPVSSSY